MGHDSLQYHGRHAVFSDVILWMLRCFLLEEARLRESGSDDSELATLREFFEGWSWLGTGVVMGTEFDRYINETESRRQLLLDHLQQTGDRISAFGEWIPVSYLNAHVDCGLPVWDREFPTTRLLKEIGRVCNLLSPRDLDTK